MISEYENWRFLARCYLDLQNLRKACELRLYRIGNEQASRVCEKLDKNKRKIAVKILTMIFVHGEAAEKKFRKIITETFTEKEWLKLKEEFMVEVPAPVYRILRDYYETLIEEEKGLLKDITVQLKEHPIWKWCENVKGLGPVGALTFLGFINPYIADTAGKPKAYVGFIPGAERKKGELARVNWEFKGRVWLVIRNIIMSKDEYYYPLYQNKKNYYLETPRKVWLNGSWMDFPPFKQIIANPMLCPRYEECRKRLEAKAKRLGRPSKSPPCKGHLDGMAKRWLGGIIISHAAELLRIAEGLPVENYHRHRGYIPPKPIPSE